LQFLIERKKNFLLLPGKQIIRGNRREGIIIIIIT